MCGGGTCLDSGFDFAGACIEGHGFRQLSATVYKIKFLYTFWSCNNMVYSSGASVKRSVQGLEKKLHAILALSIARLVMLKLLGI